MSANLPSVTITKNVFTTSQAPTSTVGILAIAAASSTGTVNQPGGFARTDLAVTQFGYGPLTEYAAYDINVANNPVVLCKANATYAGSYNTLTQPTTGSSVISTGATAPFDHYNPVVTFVTGGTVGSASPAITYTYSLDGGLSTSGVQSLGTATVITIPNTGVSFNLTVGTVVAGQSFSCFTERPLMNDTDVTNALTALGNTRLPFEGILLDCSATSNTVGLVDTVLSGWEARGVFKFALINTRYKTEPLPNTETESAYATSIGNLFASSTSIRMCVGADGAHVPSPITGFTLKRPTSMLLAARAMLIPIGEDPAFVGRGPLPGANITDAASNPFDHDEELFPGLDAERFTSLRSFAPGGPQGVYVCNANTIQPSGGSFPYLQHVRVMNRGAETVWFTLTQILSIGIRKNLSADPVTGVVTIFEPDAARIETQVNDALIQPLKGQVSGFKFTLSRTDDMNATPLTLNSVLSISALVYVKGFAVQAQFSKTISVTA